MPLLKTIAKVGLASGAVAVTAYSGVWSSSTELGARNFQQMKNSVLEQSANKLSDAVEQVPNTSCVCTTLKTKWNSGLQSLVQDAATLPETISKLTGT